MKFKDMLKGIEKPFRSSGDIGKHFHSGGAFSNATNDVLHQVKGVANDALDQIKHAAEGIIRDIVKEELESLTSRVANLELQQVNTEVTGDVNTIEEV